MKRGVVLLAALLIVSISAVTQAQGVFGGPGAPLYHPPDSIIPFFTPPIFYIGWMASAKDATFNFEGTNISSFLGGDHKWPVHGLWLGLEEKINLTENVGLTIDGWFLVSTTRGGTETEQTQRSIVVEWTPFLGPTIEVLLPGLGVSEWDTSNDWWYVDAMATWGRTFQVLAGFRYEHFSTKFINRQGAIVAPLSPDDRADITINSYLPFFGCQYNLVGSNGSINLRIIGFPYLPADVSHFESGESGIGTRVESRGQPGKSGFLEAFAQTSLNLSPNASVGAFVRWNWLCGSGYFHSEVQPGALATSDELVNFDRMGVTLGGSMSVSFISPF